MQLLCEALNECGHGQVRDILYVLTIVTQLVAAKKIIYYAEIPFQTREEAGPLHNNYIKKAVVSTAKDGIN